MLDAEDIDIVDRYLKGELIGEELSSFERRLAEDDSFREEVASVMQMKSGVRLSKLEKKWGEMEEWESEVGVDSGDRLELVDVPGTKKIKKVIPINWRWLTGIAASILIVGAFFWNDAREEQLRRQRIIDELVATHFEHFPSNVEIYRNEGVRMASNKKLSAYNYYNTREVFGYKMAAPLLYELFESEKDTQSLYFSCLSYLGGGQIKKAREVGLEIHNLDDSTNMLRNRVLLMLDSLEKEIVRDHIDF